MEQYFEAFLIDLKMFKINSETLTGAYGWVTLLWFDLRERRSEQVTLMWTNNLSQSH